MACVSPHLTAGYQPVQTKLVKNTCNNITATVTTAAVRSSWQSRDIEVCTCGVGGKAKKISAEGAGEDFRVSGEQRTAAMMVSITTESRVRGRWGDGPSVTRCSIYSGLNANSQLTSSLALES